MIQRTQMERILDENTGLGGGEDSCVGNSLPPHWVSPPLTELITHAIGGDWGKPPNEAPLDFVIVACIRGTEIRNWNEEFGKSAAIRAIKSTSLTGRQLIEGDILLEISGGGPEQPVGRTVLITRLCLSHNDELPKVPTNFLRLLRPTREINSHFLNQYLQFFYNSGKTVEYQGGSNNLRNLKFTDYIEIPIPLPPLNEQKRIVEKIEELFSEIEAGEESLRQARRQLGLYRQSLLQQAFQGKLTAAWREQHPDLLEEPEELLARIEESHLTNFRQRVKDWEEAVHAFSELPDSGKKPPKPKLVTLPKVTPDTIGLPKHWIWTNLGMLKAFSLYGPRFSSDDYSDDGVYVLRTSDINESGKVNLSTAPRLRLNSFEIFRYRCNKGDLLITRTGSLGTLAVFNDDVDSIPGAYLIQFRLSTPEYAPFLYHFLKSPTGQTSLTGGGAGVGRPNLNAPTIESIPIPLPSLPEQEEIVRLLDEQFSVIEENEREIDLALKRSEALRQSILKKAFSGQLVPQDPTDEPASALLARIRAEREATTKAPKKKRHSQASS